MTKEPIIINDVDVSGCECIIEDYQRANNFKGRYEHIKNVCELGERGAEYYNLFCKDNPNCYYKQLKRKEQECEILKIDNKEQKRQLRVRANILKLTNEKNNELKQALTEIKKIAEIACCNQPTSTCEEFKNCEECGRESDAKVVKQILQKCEVIKD